MSVITPYQPLPVQFSRGEGVWLWDIDGKRYLDAIGGIAVTSLGHRHPRVIAALTEQANLLLHTSNVYQIPQQIALGEALCDVTGLSKIFFANSGAEANEAAIKLSRLWGHKKSLAEPKVLVMEGAFHGRTMATLSASSGEKIRHGFEPFVPGFLRVPFNDLAAVRAMAAKHADIAAILVEPIQGEGGIRIPDAGYLKALRDLCDQHDWLLMLDEIQTGLARTGSFYAYQAENIQPDVLTTAKALGNGVPISACLMGKRAADLFQHGSHGSTFGGNPLACHVGLAVIETLRSENFAEKAREMGAYFVKRLQATVGHHTHVEAIRGKGMMIGIELKKPSPTLLKNGLKHGILFNITAEKVVRLLPPLIFETEHVDHFCEQFAKCLEEEPKAE